MKSLAISITVVLLFVNYVAGGDEGHRRERIVTRSGVVAPKQTQLKQEEEAAGSRSFFIDLSRKLISGAKVLAIKALESAKTSSMQTGGGSMELGGDDGSGGGDMILGGGDGMQTGGGSIGFGSDDGTGDGGGEGSLMDGMSMGGFGSRSGLVLDDLDPGQSNSNQGESRHFSSKTLVGSPYETKDQAAFLTSTSIKSGHRPKNPVLVVNKS